VSKRLQVLLDDAELRDLRRVARANRMTVAEWVRQTLRTARRLEPLGEPARKLQAIRGAVQHDFPTADVEVMLREIERGYSDRAPR
jgi:hypothetical protein